MKFLCVECDEAMTLTEVAGPDDGSMTVIFGCGTCGKQTAMLTNTMETQLVRSLGIEIGGRKTPASPMEMVRTSLAEQRDDLAADGEIHAPEEAGEQRSGSGCPFTGMVDEAFEKEASAGPRWTQAAEKRIAKIPSFARSMARKSIEDYAQEQGYAEIDEAVMDEVRGGLGL